MTENHKADVVILTALPLEHKAMLSHMDDGESIRVENREYTRVQIGRVTAVICCAGGMGNVQSAVTTYDAITAWNPTYVLLVGYAGGVKKQNERYLGDVLVANQVVDYELAKVRPGEVERRFRVYPASARLLAKCQSIRPDQWIPIVKASRTDGTDGRVNPMVHFGAVASGHKVITAPELVGELVAVWPELVGVEMEAGGAAAASHQSANPPHFIMIKGISDWADPSKEDGWQTYAADAAAAFALTLIRSLEAEQPLPTDHQVEQHSQNATSSLFSGATKISICRRLTSDWKDLADFLSIPSHDRERFDHGRGPAGVWDWLEARGRLLDLPGALREIGRDDLAEELSTNPR